MKTIERGHRSRRHSRNVFLGLESLEERTLLSSNIQPKPACIHVQPLPKPGPISVNLVAGTLRIIGNNCTNDVEIQENGRLIHVTVTSNNNGRITHVTKAVRTSVVNQIVFQNGGGSATVNSNVSVPTTIYNGAGHTVLNAPPGVVSTLPDSVSLVAGKLEIVGDNHADNVTVQQHGNSIYATVTTNDNGVITKITKTVPTSAVQNIVFQNGGGSAAFKSNVSVTTSAVNGVGQTTVTAPAKVDMTAALQWNALKGPGNYAEAESDLSVFTDHGFVLDRAVVTLPSKQQEIVFSDQGDATWRTGLALIDASLSGNAKSASTYINALTTYGWVNGAPVRDGAPSTTTDPNDPRPLSHDGFDTMLAGLYYAGTQFGPSTGIPAMAETLVAKYNNFLIANDWHLYPNGSPPAFQNITDYILVPSEIAAFKFVAGALGVSNSGAITIPTDLSAEVLSILSGQIAKNLDSILANIEIPITIFGADAGLPGMGTTQIDLTIPQGARSAIVNTFTTLFAGAADLDQVPEFLNQAIEAGLGSLSWAVPASVWQEVISQATTTALPWLNPQDLAAAASIILGCLQQQSAVASSVVNGHQTSPTNYYFVNDFFWQIMPTVETHPDIMPLIMPNLDLLYGAVASDHMAEFAWLTGNTSAVASDMQTLANHEWDNTQYVWQQPLSEQQSVYGQRYDGGEPRLDFLVMTDLINHGVPNPPVVDLNSLTQHCINIGKGIAAQIDSAIGGALSRLGSWIATKDALPANWLSTKTTSIMTGLNNAIQGLNNGANQTISGLNSSLSQQVSTFNSAVTNVTSDVQGFITGIQNTMSDFGTWVNNTLISDINGIGTDISNAAKNVAGAVSTLNNDINGVISQFTSAISAIGGELSNLGTNVVTSIENAIGAGANDVTSAAGNFVSGVVNGISGFSLTGADNPISDMFQKVISDLGMLAPNGNILSTIISDASTLIPSIVGEISSELNAVNTTVNSECSQIMSTLQTQIASAASTLVTAETNISQGIQAAYNTLQQNIASAQSAATNELESVTQQATSLGDSISNLTNNLTNQVGQVIVTSIVTAVTQDTNGDFNTLANAPVDAAIASVGGKITNLVNNL